MSKRLELLKQLDELIDPELYYTFCELKAGNEEPREYKVKGEDLTYTQVEIMLANLSLGIPWSAIRIIGAAADVGSSTSGRATACMPPNAVRETVTKA